MSQEFQPVIAVADMPKSNFFCSRVNDVAIVVCKAGTDYFAVSNRCTHAESTFDDGRMRGVRLICPLHGVMFDVRTGQPNGQLAREPLRCFETRVRDGMIEVAVDA